MSLRLLVPVLVRGLVLGLALVPAGASFAQDHAVGGPDAFGYVFIDSDEVGGSAVDFEDISGTGTPLSLGDDQVSGAQPLGFEFDFYGILYTDAYVSSNGFVTFLAGSHHGCCLGEIPDSSFPNGLVAAWWEDLDPSSGGTIHVETLGIAPDRRFVVQFEDVPHCCSASLAPVTFQVKLFEADGVIEVHYLAAPILGVDPTPHVAGIEDATGSSGLAYHAAATPLATPLAVRYEVVDGLSIVKGGASWWTNAGTPFAYTLQIRNVGPVPDLGVTVTDVLPAGLELVAATPDQGTCSGTTTVTCDLGALEADAEVEIDLEVVADDSVLGWITNTATVTGTAVDPFPGNNQSSFELAVFPRLMPPLFAVDTPLGTNGTLFELDPFTAAATTIGDTGVEQVHGLDVDLSSGSLYATGVLPATFDPRLFSIDASTGIGTNIGTTGSDEPLDLSFQGSGGALFALDDSTNLLTFALGTGAATPVGNTGVEGEALAFAPDGTLYATNFHNEVFRIDPTDGTATLLGTLDFEEADGPVTAMDFLPGTDFLFAAAETGEGTDDRLFLIRPSDFTLIELGLLSDFTGALAFGPAAGISLEKSPSTQTIGLGDDAVFILEARNLGNVGLDPVVPSDPQCDSLTGPTGDDGDGALEMGEVWSWTCTVLAPAAGFTNSASVTATPPTGPDVTDAATADVDVVDPRVELTLSPSAQTVDPGDDAALMASAENVGAENLIGVVLQAALCDLLDGPFGDDGDGVLEPGETWSWDCVVLGVSASLTVDALLEAAGPGSSTTSDTVSATVEVTSPAVTEIPTAGSTGLLLLIVGLVWAAMWRLRDPGAAAARSGGER